MTVHKLYEMQKYLSITNHMWDGFFVVANGDAWNALPRDIQEVIERNVPQYAHRKTKFGQAAWAALEKTSGPLG